MPWVLTEAFSSPIPATIALCVVKAGMSAWSAFGAAGGCWPIRVTNRSCHGFLGGADRNCRSRCGPSRVRIDAMAGSGWLELSLPTSTAVARPYGVTSGLGGILIADPWYVVRLALSKDDADVESVSTVIDGSDGTCPRPLPPSSYLERCMSRIRPGSSARFAQDASGDWKVAARLLGERGPFPSPRFPCIGGFTAGAKP